MIDRQPIAERVNEVISRAMRKRYSGEEWGPGVAVRDLEAEGLLADWYEHVEVNDGDLLVVYSDTLNTDAAGQIALWFGHHGKKVLVAILRPEASIESIPGLGALLEAIAAYDADPDMEFEAVMEAARPYLDNGSDHHGR